MLLYLPVRWPVHLSIVRFFANILQADMTTYIVDSIAQQVYEDSEVPEWQNSMEGAVAANTAD